MPCACHRPMSLPLRAEPPCPTRLSNSAVCMPQPARCTSCSRTFKQSRRTTALLRIPASGSVHPPTVRRRSFDLARRLDHVTSQRDSVSLNKSMWATPHGSGAQDRTVASLCLSPKLLPPRERGGRLSGIERRPLSFTNVPSSRRRIRTQAVSISFSRRLDPPYVPVGPMAFLPSVRQLTVLSGIDNIAVISGGTRLTTTSTANLLSQLRDPHCERRLHTIPQRSPERGGGLCSWSDLGPRTNSAP